MPRLRKKARFWLCLPFAQCLGVDALITLGGQSQAYWSGDWSQVSEGFPIFAWALSHGPGAFMPACLIWLLIFAALILALPALPAEILALALSNGHTWGAMTWLVYHLRIRYELCLLYFAFTAAVYCFCHRAWRRQATPPPA